jgi:hypothetical protein
MVQYFSQAQYSSVLSHIAQTTGPGMGASKETLPDDGDARQGERFMGAASLHLTAVLAIESFVAACPFSPSFRASLTRVDVHASIDFCLERRNGTCQLAHSQ